MVHACHGALERWRIEYTVTLTPAATLQRGRYCRASEFGLQQKLARAALSDSIS
jgi:hypothetical protein